MGGELWGAKTYVTWLQEFESAKCEKKTKELIEKSFPQRRNVERCKRGKSSVEQLIVFCTFQGKITARNSTKIKKWMSGKQLHAHSHTHTHTHHPNPGFIRNCWCKQQLIFPISIIFLLSSHSKAIKVNYNNILWSAGGSHPKFKKSSCQSKQNKAQIGQRQQKGFETSN